MGALAVKEKLASGPREKFTGTRVIAVASLAADLHKETSAANDETASDRGYISSDPIGVVPGVGDSPTVPRYITKYLRSVPLKQRLLRGLNHPYAYVDNRPLTLIDPFGLYGTTSCSYYQQRCEEVGGVYYCYLAPSVCNNFPDGNWSNCVRQCLQEYDWGYCKPESTCGGGSSFPCVVNIHQMCWQECVGGGPPRPEAGPPEYQ